MTYPTVDRRTVAIAIAGGVIHAVLALWMGAFVRGRSFWGLFTPETQSGAVVVVFTVVGLVLLGSIPIVLLYRNLVAPITTLFVLFAWAFYSSWHRFEGMREAGTTSIDLYYDSLFGLLWFGPLALVLLLGGVEYALRRRFGGSSFRAVSG